MSSHSWYSGPYLAVKSPEWVINPWRHSIYIVSVYTHLGAYLIKNLDYEVKKE